MAIMEEGKGRIVLFRPHVPQSAIKAVEMTLQTRWIGQGPKVEEFEHRFSKRFGKGRTAIAVGAGTDALHLAYILAGIKEDDEVITPVFTCTATNIPLLYQRARVIFADVQSDTLNIDPKHVEQLITDKTKAIICVHYGGLPCDMNELRALATQRGIPIIEDAAHALGATYQGKPVGSLSEFTMFSFQAIKQITTGDGGMLILEDPKLKALAERIRWFGIDRSDKQMGVWENDIVDIGYKYQMTDISAAMGISALDEYNHTLAHRQKLFKEYHQGLHGISGLKFIGGGYIDREHSAWLCTVIAENRYNLQKKLRENNIESNQVHYRNDRYKIFGGRRDNLPNMDAIEDNYLVLPLHPKMSLTDVQRICEVIHTGW